METKQPLTIVVILFHVAVSEVSDVHGANEQFVPTHSRSVQVVQSIRPSPFQQSMLEEQFISDITNPGRALVLFKLIPEDAILPVIRIQDCDVFIYLHTPDKAFRGERYQINGALELLIPHKVERTVFIIQDKVEVSAFGAGPHIE